MAVTAPLQAGPVAAVRRLGHLPPTVVASLCALVLAVLVELTPFVGGDLAAQQWWASATGSPVDLGWYGGVPVASYSLLSPWTGALLGVPLEGVVGTVLGAACTTSLLGRLGPSPARLTTAGVAAAATWAADQWSGRTTFGLGAALAALALVVATGRRPAARPAAALLAGLAGATSPLASVFLLVAAAAWWWADRRSGRSRAGPAQPWWIAGGALVPVVVARLLGAASGPEPFSTHQMLGALAAAGLTWALLPSVHTALRAGVALTAVLLVATWTVGNPIGSNSVRPVLLFAVPVLVAVARSERVATLLAALAVTLLLPPVLFTDLVPRDAGSERAQALLAELAQRGPAGRIEVVPTHGHAESVEVARSVPLARGWLRQLDTARNPMFYDGSLDSGRYRRWLGERGVSYVVLPRGPLDWASEGEARLVRGGVPGLSEVWADRWWRLYEVPGGGPVVGATLVSSDRSRMVVDVTAPGRVQLAVWWSQWSSLSGPGGCVRPGAHDGWTMLVADRPGRYELTSSWRPTGRCA